MSILEIILGMFEIGSISDLLLVNVGWQPMESNNFANVNPKSPSLNSVGDLRAWSIVFSRDSEVRRILLRSVPSTRLQKSDLYVLIRCSM